MNAPVILPLGEAAITIRLGDTASVEIAERSAELAERIRTAQIDGVREVVSAVASVTVFTAGDGRWAVGLRDELERLLAHSPVPPFPHSPFSTHTIPTHYTGIDLDEVSERVGLPRAEIIRRHTDREYRVLAIGFMPGWGYLGPLDPALSLPRRATPRTRIPAGSVAIMGAQTGIYPRVSPGGWHLIGVTETVLFDAARATPSLFRAGDRVRFTAVA